MDNFPRQKLHEIIAQYGATIYEDRRRLEALLNDMCGEYRREINVLIGALKEHVPEDLLSGQDRVPIPVLTVQLTKRLQDSLGLTEESATWAVKSWAICLGVDVPTPPEKTPSAAKTINIPIPKAEFPKWLNKLVRPYIEQVRLAWALLFDARVPTVKKLIPIVGAAYIISPLSLIINLIPIAGFLTNLAVFMLALALFNRSVSADVVQEHVTRIRSTYADKESKPSNQPQTGSSTNNSATNSSENRNH